MRILNYIPKSALILITGLFVISFLSLGWLGLQVVTPLYTWLARFFSVVYFSFFLLMPFYTAYDKDKAVPDRVTD